MSAGTSGGPLSSSEHPAASHWSASNTSRRARRDVVRLFCFPYAGGGASIFRSWKTALAPAIEVIPVQLPGREDRWREPPLTDLPALVVSLSDALRRRLEPPFAFFGHSMGAFLAFELARHLRREQSPAPVMLLVSGARAPQIPDPDPQTHRLPADELLRDLRRLGGIPSEFLKHQDLMALMLPTLRADLAVCETYVYRDEPPLDCPLSAFGGDHDSKIPPGHLSSWKAQTTGEFRLRMFPGNHFFFLQEGGAAVLQALRDELASPARPADVVPALSRRASVERTIAGVWREVLGVASVGPDDNFFDLGGNSLLMVQMHSRLRQSVLLSLSVLDLFRYPTVRMLASAIEPGPLRPNVATQATPAARP